MTTEMTFMWFIPDLRLLQCCSIGWEDLNLSSTMFLAITKLDLINLNIIDSIKFCHYCN